MKTAPSTALVLVFFAATSLGCVSQARYEDAVAHTATTRAELAKKSAALEEKNADLTARRLEIAKLRGEIEELSKTTDRTRSANGARIAELQRTLAELQAKERAAESRAALYRDLTMRLKRQIDDGDLSIVIRDGRMVLQLPNDVLFDTGRTELKPAGEKALDAVAGVMKVLPDRQFQVAGHTDNVPIRNERFPSNWELSSGRGLRVVHYLIGKGVDAKVLSAAGYGEVDPIASNEVPDGRKKNRRTEITLQPNINELVEVPR